MSNLIKRGMALLLVLFVFVSSLPALSFNASAASGYIYNWGERGEVATSLSENAEAFYRNNNTSYQELSSYSGSSDRSSVPSSDLYRALKNLMTGAQHYKTSYSATKELFRYTDCQNGGGAISSFYSGNQIGPSWDGNWNREHTWPKSKGLGGDDEDDIMMLRPTSSSENSSRGNTAYGKSSGYYNPNSESGGKYDLRGDVARIFLYVYVRWGNTSSAWGSGGVMESREVLLEWMEADPVDTWELGRNDAVESITGTRNVFVDYPELCFILFGENIPGGMTTPSGKCDHNNFNSGVTVPPTCTTDGYVLYTCMTAGCGRTYTDNRVAATGHSYTDGVCTNCGEAEVDESAKPTYVKELEIGKAYKLGFYSVAKGQEYFFAGTMSTQNQYYGATDTAYANGVDVYVEAANGGYYMSFNYGGAKKYINVTISNTHYNFTLDDAPTSVFTWDTEKYALKTIASDGKLCYIGNYGSYVNMGTILDSKYDEATNYIARLYVFGDDENIGGGGTTTPDDSCQHNYSTVVIAPTCTSGGFTIFTCSLCNDEYTGNKVAAKGHSYANDKCTVCGAEKSAAAVVTISFADKANRTQFTGSIQVWQQNGITVTNNKASASSAVADYANPIRCYQGSEVIIQYPGMVKLELDCKNLESKYVESWVNNAPTGATATKNGGIVTLEFASPVDSVTYSQLAKQSRAYSITVYTAAGGGATPSPSCEHLNFTFEGAVAATCQAEGHTGKVRCLDCDEIISNGETISLADHNWVDADCDTPKTCSVCQATEGAALGHDWTEDDGTKTCARCGATETVDKPDDNENPDNDKPDDNENPDVNNPDNDDNNGEDDTTDDGDSDNGETVEKDHSKCEASGFKKFITALLNFLRSIFGGQKQCVCGEFYD